MTHAYSELYLDDAMRTLGETFDYAVCTCGVETDMFAELFMVSQIAERFGKGDPVYVAGMSGIELTLEIFIRTGFETVIPEQKISFECSPQYWCGWILAYYQWYSAETFKNILKSVSVAEILKLYPVLHEAPPEKFAETAGTFVRAHTYGTRLKKFRKEAGYSQRGLAEKSGVSLRMIQQYEQRAKDINKSSAEYIFSLAGVLGCRPEDLMEPVV